MALDHVLLAVGPGDAGSAATLANPVVDVAGPADASVTIFHVFEEDHFEDLRTNLPSGGGVNVDPDAMARRHATVRQIGRRLADAGVGSQARGGVGDPADEIVDASRRTQADLVVIGGRGRSPAGKALFGSTAEPVLRRAEAPVMFVKRSRRSERA